VDPVESVSDESVSDSSDSYHLYAGLLMGLLPSMVESVI